MERQKKEMKGIQELDKRPLFCNQMTVSHSATEFFMDFRLIYPQFAPDNSQTPVVLHKTIMVTPYHLKEILKTLTENIERYEKDFGKIKEPEAIKKAKKKAKSRVAVTASAPDYLG